ncbi:lipopolysaccharide biosynthesis protein [Herbaspirillum robiniae]|uniref:lipopolysaccharide biosynthesis protein n=1 Tax=Herbaspirillum robiniae TaxID=2014887 RepID=UPI003D76CB13
MFNAKSIVGPALIYTATGILSAGIPFLLLPLLTRVLTPEEYGQIAMFSVILTLLAPFTGINTHSAIGVRYFSLGHRELRQYVFNCLLILAASSATLLVVVIVFGGMLEHFAKLPISWLVVATLTAAAQFLLQTQLVLWQSSKQPLKFGALRLSQTILDAGSSVALVAGFGLAWEGRVSGIAIATVSAAAIALICLVRGGWIIPTLDREHIRNALSFGAPLIPHTIGAVLLAMADRTMISNLIGVAETGLYMVALQVGMVLYLLTDALNKVYAPWLMETLKAQDGERDRRIVRYTYVYFSALLLLALLLGLSASPLLQLVAGNQFQAAAPNVIYIAFGFAFGGMYYMVTNYVFFSGFTGRLAFVSLSSGLVNIGASYVLIKHHGVIGAAQAFMLSQAMLFLGTWALAQRCKPMPWRTALTRMNT